MRFARSRVTDRTIHAFRIASVRDDGQAALAAAGS